VTPNHSVKPTHSGLRPPRAAYLKRWAEYRDIVQYLSSCQRMSTLNQCPAKVVAGRPSAGGRRTVAARQGCHATLLTSAPNGAGPNRQCIVQAAHARLGEGCPSFGGQRSVGSHSAATVGAGSLRCAVLIPRRPSRRVVSSRHAVSLALESAEYGLPNPAFKRTCLRQAA
jgi:hypothetical protein